MDQLAGVWRTELGALRDEEATRGNAAVERLGELQAALATHLATLGSALEAPMTRLMQTASEVPQAAAGVIAHLRQEMSRITEQDNLALKERTAVMDKINALLQTINQASVEQRAAIESLAASAAAVMDQASQQFADTLGAQAGKSAEAAAQVVGSAVELSSLGESFNHGVQLFNATNEKLIESLQRMEGTMSQSMARSDEQLAYYVAQAREVIDLSITSQQGIVEDLRQLHSKQASLSVGVAG
jgi:ABC-type transporter Mla subunit MlaD